MFINRSISSQKKVLFNLILSAPRASTTGKSLLSPIPGGYALTLSSGGLLTCFFPPENPPFLNPTPKSPLATPIKSPLTPTASPNLLFLWVTTTLTANIVTISTGYGHLGCYGEKDSETISRISRKECHAELECEHEVQEVGSINSLAHSCGACMLVFGVHASRVLLPWKPGTQSHTLYSCPL